MIFIARGVGIMRRKRVVFFPSLHFLISSKILLGTYYINKSSLLIRHLVSLWIWRDENFVRRLWAGAENLRVGRFVGALKAAGYILITPYFITPSARHRQRVFLFSKAHSYLTQCLLTFVLPMVKNVPFSIISVFHFLQFKIDESYALYNIGL